MTGEILRLKPDQVINEIRQGKIAVVSAPKPVERPKSESIGTEKAKRIFGENFLGPEAILVMEDKLWARGVKVEFEIPKIDFPYSEVDIEKASRDVSKGKSRMVVLRPEWMIVKEGNQDVRKPVNILNLRDLFKNQTKDGSGRVICVSYDFNPFGKGSVFYSQDWYDNRDFAKEPLKAGYAMPTKRILPNSTNITWNDQQTLLEPGERRREANEAVWDMILYYASTGKKILGYRFDWTSSRLSDGRPVGVSGFASGGLCLNSWFPSISGDVLGVCPSR
jgi:hypothetical protein